LEVSLRLVRRRRFICSVSGISLDVIVTVGSNR
jgi:hypothetical protein